MYDRVDKLAERLDKLDGVEAPEEPSAPKPRPRWLSRFMRTPITNTLAIVVILLCALTLKSVVFNSPVEVDQGYTSSSESHLMVDDQYIKPPLLRVNHTTDQYIDYSVFIHQRDRPFSGNMEVSFIADGQREKSINIGSCLTASKDTVVVKTCRTQIPYGTKDGNYKLRTRLLGKKKLESSTFSITIKKP